MPPTNAINGVWLVNQERFWNKVQINYETGCWEWTSSKNPKGYGQFWLTGGGRSLAHRYSYRFFFGEIQDGLLVCHTCDNTSCVRPDHLFIGTQMDNMHDASVKNRVEKGEERPDAKLTPEDVYEIRTMIASGIGQRAIASRFGVCQQLISHINIGKNWKHI